MAGRYNEEKVIKKYEIVTGEELKEMQMDQLKGKKNENKAKKEKAYYKDKYRG